MDLLVLSIVLLGFAFLVNLLLLLITRFVTGVEKLSLERTGMIGKRHLLWPTAKPIHLLVVIVVLVVVLVACTDGGGDGIGGGSGDISGGIGSMKRWWC